MQTKDSLCRIHNLEFVAVDESSKCEPDNRYLCLKCLMNKMQINQVIMIDEALNNFKEIKGCYIQRQETQSKQNIEILNELSSNTTSLKNFYNTQFDKIIENIKTSIDSIKERQKTISLKLEQIEFKEFLSSSHELSHPESDYKQIKDILQTQFDNLSNTELWNKCQNNLSSLDDEVIIFVPEEKPEILQQESKQKTPYLPLTCEHHDKEIILFDLTQSEKAKIDRIVCINCLPGKIGPFTNLETLQTLWNDYQRQKKELLTNQNQKHKQKIKDAQQIFNQLLQNFQNSINGANLLLMKNDFDFNQQLDQIRNRMDIDWKILSKDEIIDIAETLSLPEFLEQQKQQCQSEFKQKNQIIDEIIRQTILHLSEIYSQCYNSLLDLHDVKLIKKICDHETQTESQTKELKQNPNFISIAYKTMQLDIKAVESQTNMHCCINKSLFTTQYGRSNNRKNLQCQSNNINISYLKKLSISQCKLLSKQFHQKLIKKLAKLTQRQIIQSNLIYLGSRDGLNANSFWSKVNGKKNLFMIFQSKNKYVFGGFSPCQWQSHPKGTVIKDDTLSCFLFSQTHNQIYPLKKERKDYAHWFAITLGPVFGTGDNNDMLIRADFTSGYSNLGSNFETNQTDPKYLFGDYQPNVEECEIYELILT